LSESLAIQNQTKGKNCRTAVGIYAESALGTLINLQLTAQMPAEQTFFLMMTRHVSTLIPRIQDGKIKLPDEPDLERFVDWKAVKRFEP
jgi:L-alanine-DL-glutamate epimerase-like enolase superfamily enzyme